MLKRSPLLAALVLAAPASVLVPMAAAWGDSASPPQATAPAPAAAPGDAGGPMRDPDNRRGLAEWMDRCVQGNAKFMAKDIPGAIDFYRQAIQLAPKRPLPHYLLAEAQLAALNLTDAEATLKEALELSDDRDANVRGKILFLSADVLEREKKWLDAKAAWQTYADYSSKHADAGMAPSTPPARVQAIDDMIKQDKAYEIVRQRIVDELRDAGPAPAATPAKKK
jgi:tetratricopeptide (TPR) repeat protein